MAACLQLSSGVTAQDRGSRPCGKIREKSRKAPAQGWGGDPCPGHLRCFSVEDARQETARKRSPQSELYWEHKGLSEN